MCITGECEWANRCEGEQIPVAIAIIQANIAPPTRLQRMALYGMHRPRGPGKGFANQTCRS
eukprot:1602572-Amphidinium_carterae.2